MRWTRDTDIEWACWSICDMKGRIPGVIGGVGRRWRGVEGS